MFAAAVKGIWAYKRRFAATIVAVILGVAFLAGTMLLGDTLRANFDKLFNQADGQTDVVVRSATAIGDGQESVRTGIDANLLPVVAGVSGVADAAPYIEGYGRLLGDDGKPIAGGEVPARAAYWITDPALNPYHLVQGRAPTHDNEVVINRGSAETGHLSIGDTTTLLVPQPLDVTVVGIATFGDADGFGSATFAGLTMHAAQQHLTQRSDRYTQIMVSAEPGTTPDALAQRVQAALPTSAQAITGSQLADEAFDDINSGFLGFLRTALTIFAVIALLVAAFSIYNTFSIVAAQRTRDFALLRALGASRRQVVGATVVEAILIGLLGAAVGWAAGLGVAALLKAVFDGFGFALPAGGLVVKPTSAVIAVLAGLLATVVAGVAPALRASRVAPVAALRDVAAESTVVPRRRTASGAALLAIGLALVVVGAIIGQAILVGGGAAVTIVGMIVFGPVAARLAARVVGRPIVAARGVTGALARSNAVRNPRRTAATASALMVGVAVVTLFTVVGASMKASAADGVDKTMRSDLIVDIGGYGGQSGAIGLSPELVRRLAAAPGVGSVVPIAKGRAVVGGQAQSVSVVNPAELPDVVDVGAVQGSLDNLDDDGLAVSEDVAKDKHWSLGSTVAITYPDGATARLRLVAVYERADMTGGYLLSPPEWASHVDQTMYAQIMINTDHHAELTSVKAAVSSAAEPFGDPRVQDQAEYRASVTGGVDTILGLIYVMLALAIVIALMGIGNTLTLSIRERTRELGLLRAVGQSRAQTRSMIRWESLIIALFGAVGGVMLGLLLGWAVVAGADILSVFAVPSRQMAVFLTVGAICGVLAGARPARRAARTPILDAMVAES
jgi:putative ABC transport system permease protein